jgi:hypothetical protein
MHEQIVQDEFPKLDAEKGLVGMTLSRLRHQPIKLLSIQVKAYFGYHLYIFLIASIAHCSSQSSRFAYSSNLSTLDSTPFWPNPQYH